MISHINRPKKLKWDIKYPALILSNKNLLYNLNVKRKAGNQYDNKLRLHYKTNSKQPNNMDRHMHNDVYPKI